MRPLLSKKRDEDVEDKMFGNVIKHRSFSPEHSRRMEKEKENENEGKIITTQKNKNDCLLFLMPKIISLKEN